jgi:pimeloyl-[acyl-carrier protein] synthase
VTTQVENVSFALDDPGYRRDPYPTLRRVREEHRIFWHDGFGAYVVPRYADIEHVLKGTRWHVRPGSGFQDRQFAADEIVNQIWQGFYYFLDDLAHQRLRSVVSTTFTPRIVTDFRPRIQQIADELLDASLGARGEAEFMSDVAYPLTIRVVTEILGAAGQEDQAFFRQHAIALAGLLEWDATPQRLNEAAEAMLAVSTRFFDILEERRESPRDDLLSRLIAARAEGRTSDSFEIVFMCVLLVTVGYETTMNHLGDGMLTLLRNPGTYRLLGDQPGLLPGAVDELLRYEAPVQVTARTATQDIQVAGQLIREGEQVVVLLAGGNRDPAQFPEPDVLDVSRPNASRHLSFGHGPHFCLGAALAKTEAEIVFGTMSRRFPNAKLTAEPQWRDTAILRALDTLKISAAG